MSGGGSSSPAGNTTTTSTSAPWSGQQPYLQTGFQQAQNLYNQGGPQYYPGQTYASETPQQSQAINMATQRAQNGSPVVGAADNAIKNVENGNFLSAGNPYFQNMFQGVANAVTPAVASSFEGNGRYGSGAMANALSSSLSQEAGNLGYQNYGQGMQNMMQGALLAPSLANQDYADISQLSNAGAQQQALNQAAINDQIQRYNYNQNLPYNNLANYMGFINGNYGNSATQTTPYYSTGGGASNALGGALGGAASGAMMGSMFGPWGTAIGGIGGGLLGAFR